MRSLVVESLNLAKSIVFECLVREDCSYEIFYLSLLHVHNMAVA